MLKNPTYHLFVRIEIVNNGQRSVKVEFLNSHSDSRIYWAEDS